MKHLGFQQRAIDLDDEFDCFELRYRALADLRPVTSGLREAVEHAHRRAYLGSSMSKRIAHAAILDASPILSNVEEAEPRDRPAAI